MPNGEQSRTADLDRLIGILTIVIHVLGSLVTNSENRKLFVEDSQEVLVRGWPQVAALLDRAIGLLRERIVNWEALQFAGLTGEMLAVKHTLFMQSAAPFRERTIFSNVLILGGSRRRRDELDRFMQKTNTIIGSLSKVFPFLEPVGEYKEMVHASMK
jgi:hypothetical protein